MTAEPTSIDFVDTETSGFVDENPDAEILEIAVIRWRDGNQEVLLEEKIRPKRPVPVEASRVNGYTPAAWKGAQSWDVHCSKEISSMLSCQPLGGSNPAFDRRMIDAECFRTGQPRPRWSRSAVDTSTLGSLLWLMGEVDDTKLPTLAAYFGIKHAAHTALGDCKAAIGVWEAFFDLYVYRPREMRRALEELETQPVKYQLNHAGAVLVIEGLHGPDDEIPF